MALTRLEQLKGAVELKTTVEGLSSQLQILVNTLNELMSVKDKVEVLTVPEEQNTEEKLPITFTLAETPTEDLIKLVVNGVTYFENKGFTVDRATKTLTWTFTSEAEGFDLKTDFEVIAEYKFKEVTQE